MVYYESQNGVTSQNHFSVYEKPEFLEAKMILQCIKLQNN